MLLENQKLKPTCGNCQYVYHLAGDPQERERCKLVGRYNLVETNPLAVAYCEKTGSGDLCEYHQPTERLKSRIDYIE